MVANQTKALGKASIAEQPLLQAKPLNYTTVYAMMAMVPTKTAGTPKNIAKYLQKIKASPNSKKLLAEMAIKSMKVLGKASIANSQKKVLS